MCGIAGLQITSPGLRPRLGEFLVPMLGMLAGQGPAAPHPGGGLLEDITGQ